LWPLLLMFALPIAGANFAVAVGQLVTRRAEQATTGG